MTIAPTHDYVADEYGFPLREYGAWGYDMIMGVVEYTDDGVAVTIGEIPVGAILLPPMVNVVTLFDDTGTDLLDIGNTGTGDAYASNLDLSSAGQIPTGMVATAFDGDPLTEGVVVTAQYDGQNGNAAQGKALVIVPFFRT